MGDDFGIRLRLEDVPFPLQLLFQRQVVFHNTVVDHNDIPGAVAVGMGILLGGTTVSSPARVADAIAAIDRIEL